MAESRSIFKSKTFWAAIVQFLVAFTTWATGEIGLWALIMDFVAMLGIVLYRDTLDTNLRNFFNRFAWWGDKTVWVGIAAMLGAVGAWLGDQITLMQMLIAGFTAIVGIFVRSGSSKPEEQT